MINRAHRFHGYGSLRYVYRNGKTVRGAAISLKYSPNPKRSSYRLAVVVSRKVNKSAVVRNRIRRRLYESVRALEDKINGPYDIVLTVFHDTVAEMPADKLGEQIKNLLQEAGITGSN